MNDLPPSDELLRYAQLLKSEKVGLVIKSSKLTDIIEKIEEMGFKTGAFSQIEVPGFFDEGHMKVVANKLNRNDRYAVISTLNKEDERVYILIKGLGHKNY